MVLASFNKAKSTKIAPQWLEYKDDSHKETGSGL